MGNVGESMAKKKYRQREMIWRVLMRHGAMTSVQICDHINNTDSKYGVSLIPRSISTLMLNSHLFKKHSITKVKYLGGQTSPVIVWQARSIDELAELFSEPRRRQFGLRKLPSVIRSEVESKLEELP